jgi:hypothetical protein
VSNMQSNLEVQMNVSGCGTNLGLCLLRSLYALARKGSNSVSFLISLTGTISSNLQGF